MRLRRGLLCTLALAALVCASAALADGDPASDYLIVADAYYPYSPQPSASLRNKLDALLARTRANHYAVKVALIQTRGDLGAYPELFGKPQKYAKLLASEITYGKRHPHLLVVMPNGFGGIRLANGWEKKLAKVRIDRSKKSNGLILAGLRAVPKLAGAAGHPLP